ncbi:DUF1800 domain-containing protein [Maribacter algarum]|uniref:DUF1800 domain-containing protein n=1 Tax=Maribacter algarum (ex Zhang et al. 2020) TaxID=2578118 RepID=A0A5S3PU64_9FLAO|nr:DUF1800 domain-containing protein [Maribacter algarum]TMM58490.1 DUF1800 domain-containing protein [Maribacter algarum]
MEYFINCNTSPLSPYAGTLSQQQVEHLYRRLGFSASVQTINAGTGQTAGALVDNLINQAIGQAPIPAPAWANWNNSNYPADEDLRRQVRRQQQDEWELAYANSLLNNDLRDRLSFFWSNHFVTELDIYDCNAFLYEYVNCLQRNAIGNFRTFVSEIGLTSAMLYYLDGVYNNGNNPNENYARELYELFSLGDGNGYTEEDIIETAKALTGYVERGELGCEAVLFNPERHDAGPKTIFGQTGNWGYDDVINILFTQRPNEIAEFICRKLYEFFVHPDSRDAAGNAQTIISGMAATFVGANFEIAPVLSQLFKSEHFFDQDAIGVIIKSPYDLYFNFIKETGFTYTDTTVASMVNYGGLLSQRLFDPVDVAGWQRDRSWINTNFMIGRWLTLETILEEFYQANDEEFRAFAVAAVGPANSNTSNPELVTQAIVDKITPKGLLTSQDFQNALSAFKVEDVPEIYYSPDYTTGGTSQWMLSISPQVPNQVYLLLVHLSRQPEFQLK